MEIRICTRAEYPEFLDMAAKAFGEEKDMFPRTLANCTPFPADARDEEIARHWIALEGCRIIGGLGAYPFDWMMVSDGIPCTVRAYSVGQVSCLPEYRGQGVMTGLMKASARAMAESGAALSWLSGDRFRYRHFGYETAGNTVEYTYRLSRLRDSLPDSRQELPCRAAPRDIPALDRLYRTLPSRQHRDARAWERHFLREGVEFFLADKGYICMMNGTACAEAAGAPHAVFPLLCGYMREQGLERVTLRAPCSPGREDALALALYAQASSVLVRPHGMLAVHRPLDVLKALRIAPSGDPMEQVRGILGYLYDPTRLYCPEKPVCAWKPGLDDE